MKGHIINRLFNIIVNYILQMSKTSLNYWAEFAVDIPLGLVLIFSSLRNHEPGLVAIFLTILIGLFLFSFAEYAIHHWLFHGSIQILAQGHHAHHQNPLGYDSLPFFLPALILLTLTGTFVLFIPASYAFLLTGVLAIGYVIYGLSHYFIHHHRFHQIFARNWAAHHHIHHYHADTNFGVTTPLWDILLGTRYVYDRKK